MMHCRFLLLFLCPAVALIAKPKKHHVVAGEVDVSTEGQITTVQQNTHRAIVNWDSFSIDSEEQVTIAQPSKKSAILNRVTGKTPSEIYGALSSNGKVFLLNKNGIVIGPQGRVNTAGFIASTLEVKDRAFLSDEALLFSGDSDASILNLGKIETHSGNLFILAHKVENRGTLKGEGGAVQVVGAREVLLKEEGIEPVYIRPQSEGVVINEGSIEGLSVIVKAAGDNVSALALNQQGIIQATGVKSEGGEVFLVAEKGITQVSGEVRAVKGDETGGTVHILGDQVGLIDEGLIDVSAMGHGGEVFLGGDYQGKNETIKNAEVAFVGKDAQILAQSREKGEGGRVIVWGDHSSSHLGAIDVSGPYGGGFIEVSSPKNLCYKGDVNLSSELGTAGTLLLDPSDITIGNFGGTSNPSFPTSPGNYNPSAGSANLDISNLTAGLNSGNVTVSTSAGSGGVGDVLFNDGINLSWNAPTTFTILADGKVRPSYQGTIENTHTGSGNFDAIVFSGNATPTGAFTITAGINIKQSTITSVEGNISLTGANSLNNAYGIYVWDTSTISSTGTGGSSATIQLTGSTTITGTGSSAVYLDELALTSIDGDIMILGTSSGNANGIVITTDDVPTTVSTTGAGSITLNALNSTVGIRSGAIELGGDGGATPCSITTNTADLNISTNGQIDFSSPCTLGSATMAGNLSITAQAIIMFGSDIDILGTGVLTLQPADPSTTIGIGGGATGTLRLSALNLGNFQDGFSSRVFGRSDGTGAFEVGTYTSSDPVTMQSPLGSMSVVGPLTISGGSPLTLIADQATFSSAISGTGTLTLQPGQASTTIGIGTGASGTFNLDTTGWSQIADGFSSISLGRTDQDSAIDIRSVSFLDPITIYGKEISVNGAIGAGANDVTMNLGSMSTGTLDLGALLTTTGTFQVNGGTFNNTFNVNVSGQTVTLSGGGEQIF